MKADVFIALGSCPKITSHHRLQKSNIGNLSLDGICVSSQDNYDCFKVTKEQVLSDPQLLYTIQFHDRNEVEICLKNQIELSNQFKVKESLKVDCILMWFDLYLTEDIKISTCPGSDSCWPQAVFPLDSPVVLENNDFLDTHFQLNASFKLISAQKKGQKRNLKLESDCLTLPKSMIRILNYQEIFADLPLPNISSILDLSSVPLQSLHWMKNDTNLDLTMFITK